MEGSSTGFDDWPDVRTRNESRVALENNAGFTAVLAGLNELNKPTWPQARPNCLPQILHLHHKPAFIGLSTPMVPFKQFNGASLFRLSCSICRSVGTVMPMRSCCHIFSTCNHLSWSSWLVCYALIALACRVTGVDGIRILIFSPPLVFLCKSIYKKVCRFVWDGQ